MFPLKIKKIFIRVKIFVNLEAHKRQQNLFMKSINNANTHCMKNVQIQRFFWSVFSRIRTEYGEILRIQSDCGNIRTRKNSVFGHFSRSDRKFQRECKHFFIIYFKIWKVLAIKGNSAIKMSYSPGTATIQKNTYYKNNIKYKQNKSGYRLISFI